MQQNGGAPGPQQIMMQVHVQEPRALNMQEIVDIIQQQQQHLQALTQRNQELEKIILQLQQIGAFSSPLIPEQKPEIVPWTYNPPVPPVTNTNVNMNTANTSGIHLTVPLQVNEDALKKFLSDQNK
jgi:hypothetical protein